MFNQNKIIMLLVFVIQFHNNSYLMVIIHLQQQLIIVNHLCILLI